MFLALESSDGGGICWLAWRFCDRRVLRACALRPSERKSCGEIVRSFFALDGFEAVSAMAEGWNGRLRSPVRV